MTAPAWRSIIIGPGCRCACIDKQMTVRKKDGTEESVPLFDVQAVIVSSLQATLTAALICELQRRNIRLIFCDEKQCPYGELTGYDTHHAAAGRLREQIAWKKRDARKIWKFIIFQKLEMQRNLLLHAGRVFPESKFQQCIAKIQSGDLSNREGLAARMYFVALFGKRFRRDVPSNINAGLNYGYAILSSAVTRAIVSHGYHPSLGIHHRGKTNPLNLTYDLVEPFRPFVDQIVLENPSMELNRERKHRLIDVTNVEMRYNAKRMPVSAAIDLFALEIFKALTAKTVPQIQMDFE